MCHYLVINKIYNHCSGIKGINMCWFRKIINFREVTVTLPNYNVDYLIVISNCNWVSYSLLITLMKNEWHSPFLSSFCSSSIFLCVLLFCLCLFVLLLCRKQTNMWAQGDVLRSKQQKSRVYEENVPCLISSMDDLTISSSFLRSSSMEEVRGSGRDFPIAPLHSFVRLQQIYQISLRCFSFALFTSLKCWSDLTKPHHIQVCDRNENQYRYHVNKW